MRLPVPLNVAWEESALNDLKRLDRRTRDRIVNNIERFARTGFGDVLLMEGSGTNYGFGVGNWRVLFVYDKSVKVARIERVRPRSSAYTP